MRVFKYILACVISIALLVGAALIMHTALSERSLITCNKMEVSFADSLKFVSEQNIKDYISEKYGVYVGLKLDSIKLGKIENLLESRSAIMDCQAWITDDGILHINVSQRAPVLRFSYDQGGFYIDRTGYIFPLHETYTAPVRVIKGNIPVRPVRNFKGYPSSEKDRLWIESALSLHNFINNSSVWRSAVNEVNVSKNRDIIITTNKGSEQFILGDATELKDKFDRIVKYYNYIAPQMGEEQYKSVNLKYKDQIICRKDI